MRKDLILDTDGDLLIKDGDFVFDESDGQHVANIIEAKKGDIKQYPLIGADLGAEVNGTLDAEVRRQVTIDLASDGYKVLFASDGTIEIK